MCLANGWIYCGWLGEGVVCIRKPEIPNCTAINSTVGAGDAFLGGLLVGLESLVSKNVDVPSDFTLRALLKFARVLLYLKFMVLHRSKYM